MRPSWCGVAGQHVVVIVIELKRAHRFHLRFARVGGVGARVDLIDERDHRGKSLRHAVQRGKKDALE